MTLFKLSLRNAKRQARDYLVYFVTIVLTVAMIYAFNGLVFSEELLSLALMMKSLPLMVTLTSIAVVCIMGWLVHYITGFMLSRRSREFGTYILIGLENRQVARLFFLENLAVGCCALVFGILLGNLLYQVLRALVLALFRVPYHFGFTFSVRAVALTLFYFLFIYLLAQMKSRRRIRSMKIYDLIYFERQNEEAIFRTSGTRRNIFIVSVVLGVSGTILLMAGSLLTGLIGAGCIIAFMYGFFGSFSSGVPAWFAKRPACKYKGVTLLIFRTLSAKLATMGIVMATVSLLFTAVLISQGSGLVFSDLFRNRAIQTTVFDLCIGFDDSDTTDLPLLLKPYLDYIDANVPLAASRQYAVYSSEGSAVTDYILESGISYYNYYKKDTVMKYSDYAALREMLGYPQVPLESGRYLIHSALYLQDVLSRYELPVALGGDTLIPGGIHTEYFNQYWDINGMGFILVVPDEAAGNCSIHHSLYVAMTAEPLTQTQFAALKAIRDDDSRPKYDTLLSKTNEAAQAAASTAILVFPLYYLALVLAMTAATVLTIQQFSESVRYRRQFALLRKLGMDSRDMARALRCQFAIYYAMPALPPILIAVPFILNLGAATEPGILVGSSHPVMISLVTLGLFFLIYAVYILMSYVGIKRNVLSASV